MEEVGEKFFTMSDKDIVEEFKKHEPNYGICACGAQACAAHETFIEVLRDGRVYYNRIPFAPAWAGDGSFALQEQVMQKFPQNKFLWKFQKGILYVFPR